MARVGVSPKRLPYLLSRILITYRGKQITMYLVPKTSKRCNEMNFREIYHGISKMKPWCSFGNSQYAYHRNSRNLAGNMERTSYK